MAWLSDSSTLRLLTDCCLQRTPASILWPESGVLCSSVFHSLSGGQVRFDVVSKHCPALRTGSSCCVAFNYQQRPHVFLASVAECDGSSRASKVVLTIRSEVATADRRRAFRVPVPANSGLAVEVRTNDDRSWPANAVNLSLTGMLIEFPTGAEPGLRVGATVEVRLSLGNDAIELEAEVKHRDQRAYGLFFADRAVADKGHPLSALAAIVRSLEQHWLRRH